MNQPNISTSSSADRHLPGVDIFKFLLAFGVIAIHVNCGQVRYPTPFTWIINLAVPFFFIATGFLVGRRLDALHNSESVSEQLLHRSRKLFRLYFSWLLLYLPCAIAVYVHHDVSESLAVSEYLQGVLLSGPTPYGVQLWFVSSSAIVLFLLYLAARKGRLHLPSLLVVFAAIAIGDNYLNECWAETGWALRLFYYLTHRTLAGGIYLLSGMIMARYGARQAHGLSALQLMLISAVALSLSYWSFGSSNPVLNSLQPVVLLTGGAGLLLLASQVRIKAREYALLLRSESMWIYFLHMYVIFFVTNVMTLMGVKDEVYNTFVYVAIVSGVVSMLLARMQRRRGFTRLAILVS